MYKIVSACNACFHVSWFNNICSVVREIGLCFVVECQVDGLFPNEMTNSSQVHVRVKWLELNKNQINLAFLPSFIEAQYKFLYSPHYYKTVRFCLRAVFVSPPSCCHSDWTVNCCYPSYWHRNQRPEFCPAHVRTLYGIAETRWPPADPVVPMET